jgi:hypothetical protein
MNQQLELFPQPKRLCVSCQHYLFPATSHKGFCRKHNVTRYSNEIACDYHRPAPDEVPSMAGDRLWFEAWFFEKGMIHNAKEVQP